MKPYGEIFGKDGFVSNCDECAALCCVVPSIHSPEGTRMKTVNRVCEHLRTDPS